MREANFSRQCLENRTQTILSTLSINLSQPGKMEPFEALNRIRDAGGGRLIRRRLGTILRPRMENAMTAKEIFISVVGKRKFDRAPKYWKDFVRGLDSTPEPVRKTVGRKQKRRSA